MDNAQEKQKQKKTAIPEMTRNKSLARILQAKRDISTDIWIWPFKVTKAQTDFAIQSATNDSL